MALFLASCGDGSEKLLPVRDAEQLTSLLGQIDQFANDGSCTTASEATTKVLQRIDSLPESIDARLRQRLTEGAQSLQELVNDPAGCTPASVAPPFTPPTETNPSGKEKPKPPGHERKEPPGSGGAPAPGTTPTDTGGGAMTPTETTPEPTP